jgi:DNA-binding response OmpR family regulator
MSGAHLLIVDDDDRIRELLKEYLARGGYRVTAAAGAAAARRLIETLAFDLLVLDVMMPGEDGMSLARWVRARGSTPILMLTAKAENESRIEGLALGADDYLAKPFEPQELSLRIAAILRRSGPPAGDARTLGLGDCAFELERAELTRAGQPIRRRSRPLQDIHRTHRGRCRNKRYSICRNAVRGADVDREWTTPAGMELPVWRSRSASAALTSRYRFGRGNRGLFSRCTGNGSDPTARRFSRRRRGGICGVSREFAYTLLKICGHAG